MKINHVFKVSLCAVVAGCVFAVQAADDAKLDATLAKNIQALGGKAVIEKLTNHVLKASGEVMGMPVQMEITGQAPNLQASRVEITGVGVMRDGFDGSVFWSQNPFEGLAEKSGAELAKKKRDAVFSLPLQMKQVFPTLRYAGTEKVGDDSFEVLEAKLEGGALERFFYSPQSGLLVRQVSEYSGAQSSVKAEMWFEDYKPVDGLQQAHTMRLILAPPGQASMEMKFKVVEVRHNVPVADSVFSKPKQ
jgi:hypothetical protein